MATPVDPKWNYLNTSIYLDFVSYINNTTSTPQLQNKPRQYKAATFLEEEKTFLLRSYP